MLPVSAAVSFPTAPTHVGATHLSAAAERVSKTGNGTDSPVGKREAPLLGAMPWMDLAVLLSRRNRTK